MKFKMFLTLLIGFLLGIPSGIYLLGYLRGKSGRQSPEFVEGWSAAEDYHQKTWKVHLHERRSSE